MHRCAFALRNSALSVDFRREVGRFSQGEVVVKVCKFGGSSVADAQQIRQVLDVVEADPARRIVVVSAPGKRHPEDIKVTDLLIACAEARLEGRDTGAPLQAVLDRYTSIVEDLELDAAVQDEIRTELRRRVDSDPANRARYMDLMKAAGEDCTAKLVAAALSARGTAARYINPGDAGMLLTDEPGKGRLLPESYGQLAELKTADEVIIFPGFFGYSRDGNVVTFSRGGSDITGAILAAAVKAEVYENFTDVDSVLAADPRIVPSARPIPEITYREMRELSYAGFAVLHDEAIVPAVNAGIPIRICNTHRPDAPGTVIVPEHVHVSSRVVGIASAPGFCTVYVSKYLMNREIGFGRKLLQVFEEEGLSYEHTPSGIDDMSVLLREDLFSGEKAERLIQRIRSELEADNVTVERGLALIMIVGEGMRYNVGMAAKATAALAGAGVNIEMMNQGSSEISMMFGVKADDRTRAVKALYGAFFA